MKLKEYLILRGRGCNALSLPECRAIGIDYRKGWVKRHADAEVPDYLAQMVLVGKPNRKQLKAAAKQSWTILNPTFSLSPPKNNEKRVRKKKPYNKYQTASQAFLKSDAWRTLRYEVLKERGPRCECCGNTPDNGAILHVDHIKPRYKFPQLALTKPNLQVLCEDCNMGKGAWDDTDWRLDEKYQQAMDKDD